MEPTYRLSPSGRYTDEEMMAEHRGYAQRMNKNPRDMRVKPSFLEKRLDARYPERKQQMQPTQPTQPTQQTQPTQEKRQGFFSNLFGRASKTVSSAAQHFTPEEQTKLRECRMIVHNKGTQKVTGMLGIGGKRRRSKTHRRKTHRRKTHRRKTHKRKTHKRKTNRRKH